MLFSILIPVYNVEKYIRQCVDSVLGQGERDIEIILGDDGSTDSSGTICDEYQAKYPAIVRVIHKQNEGLLFTRRRMLQEAKGEWFVHLDSDDYMMPGALHAIAERIRGDDALDLILCKVAYGARDGESIDFYSKLPFRDGQVFAGEDKTLLYRQLLNGGYMTAIYQKIARREIVDVNADYYAAYGRVSLGEDHLQSLPILQNAKKALFLDLPVVYYRCNESSITRKKSFASFSKNIWSLVDVFAAEEPYFKLWHVSDETIAAIAADHVQSLCKHIKKMMREAGNDQGVRPFIRALSQNEEWQVLCRRADRQKLGKFSRLCCFFVRHNAVGLLKTICSRF